MKVSVITVVFNLFQAKRNKTFLQTLESVHHQTYSDIEHIIIDGGSTDGTVDLLKEYAQKGWIKYVSEPDKGIYDAMNKGVKLCCGSIVTFLNSDDFFHNQKAIELSVKALSKGYDFSYAPIINLDEKKKMQKVGKIKLGRLLRNMPFPHPGMFVIKDVFQKIGGFDTNFRLMGDYDFILRLYLHGYRGTMVNKTLATFRRGGATDQNEKQHPLEKIYLYRKNYAEFCPTADFEKMAQTYIFPFKLLKALYQCPSPEIKRSCLWIGLNSLKRKLFGKI